MKQESQSSYSFGKIQNIGEPGPSEEKIQNLVFHWRKISYFVFIYIYEIYIYIYGERDI